MALFRNNNENPFDYDRSLEDRKRHRELVDKSIKNNLGDILSEESIITENENKKFKIPIKGMKEFSFIYGTNNKGVATGSGCEKRGDKVSDGRAKGHLRGGKVGAGDSKGDDIYETEITMEDILEHIIEDLELPNLNRKVYKEILSEGLNKKRGYKRYGIKPRIAKKKTTIAKIARKKANLRLENKSNLNEFNYLDNENREVKKRYPFKNNDLRYHKITSSQKKESNAVMIFIMDVSGSMDSSKKYLARSLFFVLSSFIRKKYNTLAFEFISHTTVGKVVNEYEFFHKSESGGTYISSGLNIALDLIEKKYPIDRWNIYTIYGSDGDNWSEDNENAIISLNKLCEISNLFGYAELLPSTYSTTMFYRFKNEIKHKNFVPILIKEKKDLWKGLKVMISKEFSEDNDEG